ncbi:MAG: hypothetical protein F6K50_12315 [Moorea sp. SIO3I7]|nr:hypothetical protein [Moorena sp. SIO3I8]NEN96290.1 hypothetical protein [Moorena sp. SIO3I7]NEO04874.1 hypothetical protein [Moorena sp. SIO3I8]
MQCGQDRLGALSVGELNSPRVAPLHRFFITPKNPSSSFLLLPVAMSRCSLFPIPCSLFPFG